MIVQNAVEFPDGSLLYSKHRHDYVEKDGVVLDGGLDYYRSSMNEGVEYQPICLDELSTMDDILKHLICESSHTKWSSLGEAHLKEYRQEIYNLYNGKPVKRTYRDHTLNHMLLHLYVGGYWIVQNNRNKLYLDKALNEN